MNGQGSSSNSFPETFHVGHSRNVNNLGFAQNNLVRTNSAVRDTQTVLDWMGQSSSRMNNRNPNSPQELLGGHEWFSSMDPEGTGRRFQVRHSRPNISPFQENANIILIDGQVTNGQPILHGASFGSYCQNIDLNALQDNNKSDAHQDSGAGLSLHLFMPGGVEANQNLLPGISSAPVVISSGLGGYVLKENDQREGLSSDDMRVICKRRAPEDAPRLLHLGESSRSAQESGNSEWQAVTEQRNANSSLNISSPFIIPAGVSHPEQWEDRHGIGMMGAVSGMHHTSNGAGQAEWSQRNIRLSRAANPQDLQPPSMSLSGSTGNSYLQSPIQPTMFSPFHSFPDPSSVATFRVNGTPPVQTFMHVPNSVQNMQPSQWYDLTRSRPDVSLFPPVYAVNGTNTVQQEQSSRHITRNTLLVPETDRGYVAQDPTAFYSVNGNSNYPRNIPSSSHNGTLSDFHFTSAPSWVTEYDITTQYRQRMSGVFSHSMPASSGFVCGGQCGYCPVHLGASEAARDMELSIRGGNAIPFQVHLSSGLMINPERQAGGYPENPSALESIAIQRTSGLLSEVCLLEY